MNGQQWYDARKKAHFDKPGALSAPSRREGETIKLHAALLVELYDRIAGNTSGVHAAQTRGDAE